MCFDNSDNQLVDYWFAYGTSNGEPAPHRVVMSAVSSRPSRHGKADGRMGCSRRGMTGRKEIAKAKRGCLSRVSNQERSWRSKQMVSRTYNIASKLKRDPCHTRTSRTR